MEQCELKEEQNEDIGPKREPDSDGTVCALTPCLTFPLELDITRLQQPQRVSAARSRLRKILSRNLRTVDEAYILFFRMRVSIVVCILFLVHLPNMHDVVVDREK